MKQAIAMGILTVFFLTVFSACGSAMMSDLYTVETAISDVISDPVFGDYGRLIFPVDDWYYSGDTIFYDIYTEEEKAADPEKEDTGLFFFKGTSGERFAVCNAGGAFAYVGAMQDSFPHALELSKQGYNAFALIYRPGAQTACEDLVRAIQFIFEHAGELEVNTDGYSLWEGSAGARMAAWAAAALWTAVKPFPWRRFMTAPSGQISGQGPASLILKRFLWESLSRWPEPAVK